MSGIRTFGRWGETETRVFVRLYLANECLWNKHHDDYKSKFSRDSAVNDIISKFADLTNISLDPDAAKRKIKNLRSTYSQELKLIKQRSTPNRVRKPSLIWFEEFDKCFKAKGINNDEGDEVYKQDNDDSINDTSQEIWLDQSSASINKEPEELPTTNDPFTQDDNYILLLKTEPEDRGELSIEHTPQKRKIKKQRNNSNDDIFLPKFENGNKKKRLNSTKESEAKEDEFDIYGKYIATQLREMGVPRALKVQLNIHKIVSEARIEHLAKDD